MTLPAERRVELQSKAIRPQSTSDCVQKTVEPANKPYTKSKGPVSRLKASTPLIKTSAGRPDASDISSPDKAGPSTPETAPVDVRARSTRKATAAAKKRIAAQTQDPDRFEVTDGEVDAAEQPQPVQTTSSPARRGDVTNITDRPSETPRISSKNGMVPVESTPIGKNQVQKRKTEIAVPQNQADDANEPDDASVTSEEHDSAKPSSPLERETPSKSKDVELPQASQQLPARTRTAVARSKKKCE